MPYEVNDKFDKNDFTFFDVKERSWELEMLNIIIGEEDDEELPRLFLPQGCETEWGEGEKDGGEDWGDEEDGGECTGVWGDIGEGEGESPF